MKYARLRRMFSWLLFVPGVYYLIMWAWPSLIFWPNPLTADCHVCLVHAVILLAGSVVARFSVLAGFCLLVPAYTVIIGTASTQVQRLIRDRRAMWIQAEPHPRYGPVFQPWSSGWEIKLGEYWRRYNHDGQGWRRIERPAEGADVLLLGCSYTYGAGVSENYAAILQKRWPGARIHNHACSGWGTAQALLVLEDDLKAMRLALVLYGWIPSHQHRNALRKAFYSRTQTQFPYFELENGRPAFRRMAQSGEAQEPDGPDQDAKEVAISLAMLSEMARMCAAAGVRFVVLALRQTDQPIPDPVVDGLSSRGIEWLDLRQLPGTFYPLDRHPREDWHREVAEAIAAKISL